VTISADGTATRRPFCQLPATYVAFWRLAEHWTTLLKGLVQAVDDTCMSRNGVRPTPRRPIAIALAVLASAWAMPACSAGEDVADDVGEIVEAPSSASAEICRLEQRTIATAADAFAALEGRLPASLDEVVTVGLLQTPPTRFDYTLSADGSMYAITPTAGGPCDNG
jgi:hypothetical protein